MGDGLKKQKNSQTGRSCSARDARGVGWSENQTISFSYRLADHVQGALPSYPLCLFRDRSPQQLLPSTPQPVQISSVCVVRYVCCYLPPAEGSICSLVHRRAERNAPQCLTWSLAKLYLCVPGEVSIKIGFIILLLIPPSKCLNSKPALSSSVVAQHLICISTKCSQHHHGVIRLHSRQWTLFLGSATFPFLTESYITHRNLPRWHA